MSEVVSLRPAQGPSLRGSPEDKIWAVIASVGKTSRIANIYASRDAALADRSWREQQVRAYATAQVVASHQPRVDRSRCVRFGDQRLERQ